MPQEFQQPYYVYSRLLVGSECLSELEWREKNGDEFRRSSASLCGVAVDRIEITLIDCHFRHKPEGEQILAEQTEPISEGSSTIIEGSFSVLLEFRVMSESETDSNDVRSKLNSGFVSGAFLASLANNGLEFNSFEVVANPILVRPGETTPDVESNKDELSPSVEVVEAAEPSPMPLPLPEEPPLPPGTLEAEVKSAIDVEIVFDMDYTTAWDWRKQFADPTKLAIAKYVPFSDGLTRIRFERVTRGSIGKNDNAVSVRVVILPPETSSASENAFAQKVRLEEGAANGQLLAAFVSEGLNAVKEIKLARCDLVLQPVIDKVSRCTRCRNGQEQVERDHREFTRKCNRGGSCRRRIEFSIQDSCAHGCADHCSQTCRRFHDPKARKCLSRRKMYQAAEALVPSTNQTATVSYLEISEDMRHFIRKSVEDQSLLSIDNARESSEVAVVSLCFSECARSCIETCIGQWSDDIPDPAVTAAGIQKVRESLHLSELLLVDARNKKLTKGH